MKVALAQITGGIDPAINGASLVAAVEQAAAGGAAMRCTPEAANGVDRDRERAARAIVSESEDGALAAVRAAAAHAGIWVHLGSLAIRRADGRYANRAFVIDDGGAVRARYDKLHLFDVDLPSGESWRESASYAPGEAAVIATTPIGAVGLSICYDLRFADLYRALSDAGAQVLAVPAAFTPVTGAAHWHMLLRARAIEAGAFVIAAAQTGTHADGRTTYGHSLVIDPWGEVLLDMGEEAGLGFADVDLARLDEVRRRIPALRHRRAIPPVETIR